MEIRLEGVPMWLFVALAAIGLLCVLGFFLIVVWLTLLLAREHRRTHSPATRAEQDMYRHESSIEESGRTLHGGQQQPITRTEDDDAATFWRRQVNSLDLS